MRANFDFRENDEGYEVVEGLRFWSGSEFVCFVLQTKILKVNVSYVWYTECGVGVLLPENSDFLSAGSASEFLGMYSFRLSLSHPLGWLKLVAVLKQVC